MVTPWTLAAGIVGVALLVAFAWPWVDPYLQRHDPVGRYLDRLEEDWDREHDEPDWRW